MDDGSLVQVGGKVYEANPFGLYNMHGNVAEWCANMFNNWSSNTTDSGFPLYIPLDWKTGEVFDGHSGIGSIRKLKDNNGAYIWQPSYQAGEPDRVLGYAVNTSAYAPKNAISFGDYSYYNIGDRGTRSFAELRELFAGNGMVGFVAKERVDGKLVLPEAVQILKLKTDATA